MIEDDGGPAFPCTRVEHNVLWKDPEGVLPDAFQYGDVHYPGMTLRDYFAATALRGMLTDVRIAQLGQPMGGEPVEEFYAVGAYLFADAMLKERAK